MRTVPEDAAAARTLPNVVIVRAADGRGTVRHRFLRHLAERLVADQAARERDGATCQIEALDDFGQLPARIGFAHAVSVGYGTALQQSAVAREQDAVFFTREARQVFVAVVVAIQG